ncbi:MAG: S-layer homology domain-containing protein [Clostridiales bacterium]|nr:S-layer homology domain-containing protein [Clostridiales bacterium]MDU6975030.1 S-layer homology domain-containing protein [Clostridiales bacterium]
MRLNLRLKKVLATTAAATIMATALPVVTYAADYDNHWAKEAITKWSEKEVLEGYEDGTFKPNNKVTRGELAAIIVRVFGLTDTSAAEKYTDVEATKWYASDIAKVSSAGIMNDYEDGTFKPNQEATREEAAYAIAKAYKVAAKETNVTFKDQAQISDWAEAEIASLVAGGYLNGNPDGTFRPTASLTRAEAVTMVDKITADLVNVAGTYSQDIDGHLVVNTKDVELKDMTITGNLYLAEGIGEGDVKLNNVTVLGDVIVEGGGVSTVHVLGQSKLNNVVVDKAGKNPVRVLLGNLVEVKGTITLASTSVLEGNAVSLSKVVVDGAAEPQLVGTLKIEEVIINKTTELVLVDGVTINKLTVTKDAVNTVLRGRGEKSEIKNIIVEANGLELKKGFKYNKDKVVVAEGVTTAPKYPASGGGGGGGSTGGGSTVKDKEINVSALEVKLQDRDVKVAINGKVDVVVDSNKNTVTVNGVTFNSDDVIETITATEDHGIDTLTVGLTDKYAVTLKPGTAYKVEDLKAMVADNKGLAEELLQEVGKKANLTEEQMTKAEELLDKAFGRVAAYQGTAIKVGDLLDAAKEIRNKVTDEEIQKIYDKFESALATFGVDVTIGQEELTAKGQLTVKATSAHEIDKVTVQVTYK